MDFSDVKTDVEILKKQIFGNGVKGAVQRIEDLEEKLDKLEIYMEKAFNDKIQMLLEKIDERKKISVGNLLVVAAVLADLAVGFLS